MALRDFLKGFFAPRWFTSKACRPLPLIFSQFREVLKANNQALEIIADMGEKLSGEYLFDLRYVEATVEEMIEAMHRAIAAINILTQNQCLALHEVFPPMEARVKAILNKRDDRDGPPLLWLTEVETRHWPLVGGKAAHLSELLHNPKVRVPEGFVITTRLFHDLLDLNGLRPEFDRFEQLLSSHLFDEEGLEALRRPLREKVLRAEPPSGFLDTLTESLKRLAAGNELPLFLAVRSSAQEEDMDFSFAGQFHSVLQVPPQAEAVYRAYLQVAASLFGARALRYRRQVFPEGGPMSIAACCQRMIPAHASGIIYSVYPMAPGSQSMVVVGALGQGQAVVEGQVPADFFRLSKDEVPQVVERVIAAKHEALLPTGGAEGGLAMQAVANEQIEAACLDGQTLQELAGVAMHLETFFKRPQDIEWTVDPQGALYILQSRPLLITESAREKPLLSEKLEGYALVAADAGRVAQQGIGAGPAFWVETLADLKDFPEGAVLISHRDSSQFVQVMHQAAAIVTEVGSPASHMATLCRELRVPCLVGVPDIMAKVAPGEEITVDAEDRRIYRGRVVELLTYQAT
ncbi:MAG: PEP/pyruvate-binding domain-containing protein, partial [Pseudomonadota bacterium]